MLTRRSFGQVVAGVLVGLGMRKASAEAETASLGRLFPTYRLPDGTYMTQPPSREDRIVALIHKMEVDAGRPDRIKAAQVYGKMCGWKTQMYSLGE